MFTRTYDDACRVNETDGQNELQYQWTMSSLPNFRKDTDVFQQVYRQNRHGREQNIEIENRLRDLNRVNGTCTPYQLGVQQELLDMAPSYSLECLNPELKPTYTKLSRSANHSLTWESPNRADPGWYWFVTPPDGVTWPGRGLYTFDRQGVDTRLAAKDAILQPTKQQQIIGPRGLPNPHAVPLLHGPCNHFGLFPPKRQ